MAERLFIKNWVRIKDQKVLKNGELIFETEKTETGLFLKKIYRHFEVKYPKFYKMDLLSKLGFLGTEILLEAPLEDKQTALIFGNAASSLETDEDFFRSMQDFPSPAVFVYTLPNIMLGEISIRNRLVGENLFLVEKKFDADVFIRYCEALFQQQQARNFVCGWVDLHNSDYDVFLWQSGPGGHLDLNEKELNKIYESSHE